MPLLSGKCPKCGSRLEVESAPGKRVACPHCQATLRLPGKPAPDGKADPLLGQTLGQFEIIELIGRGGMGAVYKARQPSLDRLVAVKILPQSVAADATFIERFNREARAAAAVSHPNIVQVHDVGEDKGLRYIAMEFVEGRSLSEILWREGPLPPDRALDLLRQVATALSKAHAAGIVHRDIKPGNILVTPDGHAKLADFGLAKRPGSDMSVTHTGAALGTPLYFPPEAARGETYDARSDLYSLGATFYHLLAGKPPFEADDAIVLAMKHAESPVPPLADLAPAAPASLCRVIHRLLKKNPAERYQSAEELLDALKTAEAQPVVSRADVTRSGLRGPSRPTVRERLEARKRSRRTAIFVALAVLGLIALAVILLRGGGATPSQAKAPAAPGTAAGALQKEPTAPTTATQPTRTPAATKAPATMDDGDAKRVPWKVYTLWPFDAAEAKRRQEETAKALGVPVARSLDLGGGVKMTFVLIPAGSFQMGADDGVDDERPVHAVTISRPFHLGVTEVTQTQWEAIVGNNPSNWKGGELPVETVSWPDCSDFCRRLGELLSARGMMPKGASFRLPTEAEWEYACRAGSATRFCYGDGEAELQLHAWHSGISNDRTHPVGQKRPNVWDLHDMHGNVWEWCSDWFSDSYYDAAPPAGHQKDPVGPLSGRLRVLRGGCWNDVPSLCRSACRHRRSPALLSPGDGFRVVFVPGP